MISDAPLPLVFFRVLADRAGKPAALLLDVGPGDGAGAAALLPAGDTLAALTDHLPCFYRADVAPAAAEALSAAGLQALAAGAVLVAADALPMDAPPTVSWIDGP